jgi:hypothetical protein
MSRTRLLARSLLILALDSLVHIHGFIFKYGPCISPKDKPRVLDISVLVNIYAIAIGFGLANPAFLMIHEAFD